MWMEGIAWHWGDLVSTTELSSRDLLLGSSFFIMLSCPQKSMQGWGCIILPFYHGISFAVSLGPLEKAVVREITVKRVELQAIIQCYCALNILRHLMWEMRGQKTGDDACAQGTEGIGGKIMEIY